MASRETLKRKASTQLQPDEISKLHSFIPIAAWEASGLVAESESEPSPQFKPPSPATTTLLELPKPILWQILGYVLPPSEAVRGRHRGPYGGMPWNPNSQDAPSVLRVCRKMYGASMHVMYGAATLKFTIRCSPTVQSIPWLCRGMNAHRLSGQALALGAVPCLRRVEVEVQLTKRVIEEGVSIMLETTIRNLVQALAKA
ncbi:MAG: hypothetical protein MMC23_009463 [Stictis urceolatum]|nr:hypothetical protein [Stictis urceolata]